MNNIAPKLQKCWSHKTAFKIIPRMLKQQNLFYSQTSTLAKFYLSTTLGCERIYTKDFSLFLEIKFIDILP